MKPIDAHGHVPLKDDPYKYLVNNCFTPNEIGSMLSACGSALRNLLNHPKKETFQLQIDTISAAIGKLLLALPEPHKKGVLMMFKKTLNLEFNIHEVQQPEKEQIQ